MLSHSKPYLPHSNLLKLSQNGNLRITEVSTLILEAFSEMAISQIVGEC
jgi:hypothetical protein